MMHFQQSMLQMTQTFLATQQAVMLCYLQEGQRSQGSALQAVNSRPVVHFGEPTVEPKQSGSHVDTRTRVFGFSQQTLDDQAGMLRAPENVEVPDPNETVQPPLLDLELEEVSPELDREGLIAVLMELISERTGYPIDMIDHSLDLESDLGIDSIKRIEILNKFQSALPHARRALLENSLEELASARTVNQIIEWIVKPEEAFTEVSR